MIAYYNYRKKKAFLKKPLRKNAEDGLSHLA